MINPYIIDITKQEFKDLPISLDGEIFLEKTKDSTGKIVTGFLTITVENIKKLLDKTDEELEQMGWTKFKSIIDSFREDGISATSGS